MSSSDSSISSANLHEANPVTDALDALSVDVREIFRLVANHTSDLLIVLNDSDLVAWISPSVEHLLGISPPTLLGRSYQSIVATPLEATWWSKVESDKFPVTLLARDGLHVPTHAHLLEISPASPLAGYRMILHNVSDDLATLEELSRNEQRFLALVEAVNPFVIIANGDGRIRWCSPHLAIALHCDVNHVVGRPLREVAPGAPDFATGGDYETVILGGEGMTRMCRCREVVVHGERGHVDSRILVLHPLDDEAAREEHAAHSNHQEMFSTNVLVRLTKDLMIDNVSSTIRRLLGWEPTALTGKSVDVLVRPESLDPFASWMTLSQYGANLPSLDIAIQRSDGSTQWMTATAHRDPDHPHLTFVSLSDATRLVATQQAWRTVAAAQRAISECESEAELLRAYCEVPVELGNYAFSWIGRKVDDEDHSIDIVAASQQHRGYVEGLDISWSDRPSGMGPAGRTIVTGLPQIRQNLETDVLYEPWKKRVEQFGFRSSLSIPLRVNGEIYGVWTIYATNVGAFDGSPLESLLIAGEDLSRALERLHHDAERRQLRRDQQTLATAMSQATEMVIVTNVEGRITFVNDAVIRATGYSRDELIGQFPRVLQSGYQTREFYLNLWHTLTRGHTWRGNFVNRKKNGETYEVSATLSPTYDDEGNLTGYLGLSHEVTLVKQLENLIDMGRLDHTSLAAVMRDVRQESTLELTARAMCHAVLKIRGITESWFLLFDSDESIIPLGTSRTEMDLDIFTTPEMVNHGREIRRRAGEGPWWRLVAQTPDDLDPQVNEEILQRGVVAFIHLPVRWNDTVVGVLVLGTDKPDAATWLDARLDAFAEVGAFAGSVLGEQASRFQSVHQLRSTIDDILAGEEWTPVFQPFTNLASGEVVGYEALTRFHDGTRPDHRFEEAFLAGRGPELEAACARAALRDAADLPPSTWISLNFSPDTIQSGLARQVVLEAGRPVVIEITEHTIIENYDALKSALRDIPGVKVAVDDAGSGYTSLQHIVQLRPDYVKMDISLIRGIDHDPIRQAMVAGLCYFAGATGCSIIAEGIERTEEADVLRDLGVSLGQSTLLGQGYLFGRPAPLAHRENLNVTGDSLSPDAN